MWLLCGLDDEHYYEPYFKCFDTLDKAKEHVAENLGQFIGDDVWDVKVSWEGNRCDIDYGKYWDDFEETKGFYVFQIFEVNAPYVVMRHHGYDGVDFEIVRECDSKEEAQHLAETSCADECAEMEEIGFEIDKSETSYDNGYEFIEFNVVEIQRR